MKFPPAVVAHLDQRRIRAHKKKPEEYEHPPSLDPCRDVSEEPFYRKLVTEAEGVAALLVDSVNRFAYDGVSVLDIGCGLALVDILLWRYCGFSSIYLLDGDGTRQPDRGFRKGMEAWADVKLGEAMVLANVPSTVQVHPIVAGSSFTPPQVNMVISLRSWGHHYPVSTYLDLLKKSRAGLVITDIRNRTDGVEVLANAGFDAIGRIPDSSGKCQRLVFCRIG